MNTHPILAVLSGPAGAGKSTLCERLVRECPEFARVVTSTTRKPRPGEVNGVHYHFFDPQTFQKHVECGDFLEWCPVHGENSDRLYGTLRSSVYEPLHNSRNLVMNVDVQGAEKIRRVALHEDILASSLITIFVAINLEDMERRMMKRGDKPDEIRRRIASAAKEFMEAPKFNHFIESRTPDEDFTALKHIIDGERLLRTAA